MILHVIIMREENMVVEIVMLLARLPLVMLRSSMFFSSSLNVLVFASLDNLFAYKMPMHRKYVRLKLVFHILHDALFVIQFLSFM